MLQPQKQKYWPKFRILLHFLPIAETQLKVLKHNPSLDKRFKAVKKALQHLQQNPRHPGLKDKVPGPIKVSGTKMVTGQIIKNLTTASRCINI